MSRRIQCVAIALACSALIATSSQAASTKLLLRESAPVVGWFAGTWERLMSALLGSTPKEVPQMQSKSAGDGSHLDPNGGQH
jgi:hypothetical protein